MAEGVPQADGSIAVEPLMDVDHAARAVLDKARLPLQANVQFMTVRPPRCPSSGGADRRPIGLPAPTSFGGWQPSSM